MSPASVEECADLRRCVFDLHDLEAIESLVEAEGALALEFNGIDVIGAVALRLDLCPADRVALLALAALEKNTGDARDARRAALA